MKLSSIEQGIKTIKSYVVSLPLTPGVYRMISDTDDVLYVGKAKALKKRVVSYTNFEKLPHRLQCMVSMTRRMEFINTHTEADALILEANLIKQYKPRFNILLRDDKSFPYIVLKEGHDFPQILKHRGARTLKGEYFGPFPSAGDVNRTLFALQRAFLLRNCSDTTLESRKRPCLQYHIKRCTAPCVGKVSKEEYAQQVNGAQDFMQGKSRAVQKHLTIRMEAASAATDYELAAGYRDRIRALTSIQAKHEMNDGLGDADVISIIKSGDMSCLQVFFYRGGQNLGNKAYFPRHDKDESARAVLSAFIAQFYQNKAVPKEIVVNQDMDDKALLEEAFSATSSYSVRISVPQRGKYKRAVDFALKNAQEALIRHRSLSTTRLKMRRGVAELFGLDDVPTRIEVYDNSHISGTHMVGAMIVEGEEGFQKKSYRTFNIREAGRADDYGMMREVLSRRFRNALQDDEAGSDSWPDILLIDGGLGQLSACREALEDLGILDQLTLVAIAKGEDRNAGREKFFMLGRAMFQLPVNDPVLHYLQRLRDEAHRFAIGSHRARRAKAFTASPLDNISGVGAKRKKELLLHFGSAKAIEGASITDLLRVDGISSALAQVIYDYFHEK
ncbi:MAG: excinuclease ABC subunit C [Alphaproteobacteria bacterium]|nr:MAG: excinuclease ABC subunit C [Alphaproteobacteria bacterium]